MANYVVPSGVTSDGLIVSAGSVTVLDGGLATNTTLNNRGKIIVSSGGEGDDTTVNAGGAASALFGGTMSSVIVSSGATLDIASGGTAFDIKEEGGVVTWTSGAVVSFVPSVFSKYTYSGNIAATIHSGTTAVSTTVSNGAELYVYEGGLVMDTRLNSRGMLDVYSGGEADDTTINAAGTMKVFYSGLASNVTVSSGAQLEIASDGSALAIKEEGGVVTWTSGAVVSFVPSVISKYVYSGNVSATIHSGTTATSTTLNNGADFFVYDGGLALDTDVKAKSILHVYSGGEADDTTINSAGRLNVYSSGLASNVIVSSGARLEIASDGRLTGQVNIINGATVSASAGGVIDFDISMLKTGTETRVSNLSLVKGAPVYTLTVSGAQTSRTYSLAKGASGFNKTVTVINEYGTELGTLTVGETEKIGHYHYLLGLSGDELTVSVAAVPATARGDRDGNGVSDVMFVWTGNNCAHGYWMNGKSEWWSANAVSVSADWDNLGSYDMGGDGRADAVMFGNVEVSGIKGAYIGYYQDGDDVNGWVQIGYLNNAQNIAWSNKVGNLTGNASGANSIVWYAPELYALGAWTDGTDSWTTISSSFGGELWTLAGTGDFDGDGKASIVMTYSGGLFYSVELDGTSTSLGSTNWSGWEVRAIADFSGDGKDDVVAFHKETGVMVLCADGNMDSYTTVGQLDPNDWFIAGAGDYNGDGRNDLLVRQYSTGMLGYYSGANQALWNEMGRGVDMDWTVIA